MEFWDVFLLVMWGYFVVLLLIVLFQIVTDVFRDDSLGGWGKAGWVVLLVLLPLVGAIIYVVARGDEMGDRQSAAARRRTSGVDGYTRQPDVVVSPAAEIAAAKKLADSGAITSAEFESIKAEALAAAKARG